MFLKVPIQVNTQQEKFKPKRNKLPLDSDLDDSSLLSEQIESIYSSSVESYKHSSINSDCDNETYNNIHDVNLVHSNYYPSPLLGSVIMKRNANWEIFKVLS